MKTVGKLVCFSGCSVLALILSQSAAAQCAPDPAPPFSTVTCTGNDPDGFVVDSNQTTVNIEAGARVSTLLATTIVPVGAFSAENQIAINANGAIAGGLTVNHGSLAPGAMPFFGPSTRVNLNVGAGGSIGGMTAINLIGSPANFNANAIISIDNSGTIQSANGAAIIGSPIGRVGVSSLINRASGTIGGIAAPLGTLDNMGLIDGGTGSAIAVNLGNGFPPVFAGQWRNSGVIASNGSAATITYNADFLSLPPIINSGTIRNNGSGDVLAFASQSAFGQSVTNEVGGIITATSGRAIFSTAAVQLDNRGTINGDIVIAPLNGLFGSRINLSGGGVVNGNVTLGSADDTVIVDYVAGGNQLSAITGTVNAGGGNDTLQANVFVDTTIASNLSVAGFERVGFGLGNNVAITLAPGFDTQGTTLSLASAEQFGGAGKLINKASFVTNGPALKVGSGLSLQFVNEGAITSNLANPFDLAVSLPFQSSFDNSGTITANNGSGADVSSLGNVVNTGQIVADHTALRVFQGVLDNSGLIESRQGTALSLLANLGVPARNSGTISGATLGVSLSGNVLTNRGSISGNNGTGISILGYGTIINEAGGVISGTASAIDGAPAFGPTVDNAGTINGDVRLGQPGVSSFSSSTYIARGGTLNGNLIFGGGNDYLRVVGNTLGVSGVIDGGAGVDTLSRFITQDTTFDLGSGLAALVNFEVLGFDLSSNAKLTITSAAPQALGLGLAGTGSVDIAADLSGDGLSSLVNMTLPSSQSSGAPPQPVQTLLDVVSRGNLSVVHQAPPPNFSSPAPVVNLLSGSSFTNKGTITVNDLTGQNPSQLAGISGGGSVINDGTIFVGGGAAGIRNQDFSFSITQSAINNGTIAQLANAVDGIGVRTLGPFINNGTISTGGAAFVALDGGNGPGLINLTNRGTLQSSNSAAVTQGPGFFFGPFGKSVVNESTGVIRAAGGFAAIDFSGQGGRLDNSGSILGNVLLGSTNPFIFQQGSSYVARGGTITGNLTFGAGNDTVQLLGNSLGVSGIVDGGAGYDSLLRIVTQDTSFDLASGIGTLVNFEALSFDLSNNAKLNLTSSTPVTTGISLAGSGTVDINATMSSNGTFSLINATLPSVQTTGAPPQPVPTVLNVTNRGTLTAEFNGFPPGPPSPFPPFTAAAVNIGNGSSFTNAGTISVNALGPIPFFGPPLVGVNSNGTGTIVNDGTISVGGGAVGIVSNGGIVTNNSLISQIAGTPNSVGVTINTLAPFVNNGTINMGGTAVNLLGELTNSGLIASSGDVAVLKTNDFSLARLVNSATGTITGAVGYDAIKLAGASTVDNAGTINGNVKLGGVYFSFPFSSTYISRGGTINGNLTFDAGNDFLVVVGNQTGVTGTIDGGAGIDTFVKGYTTNTTVDAGAAGALPTNFERLGIGAVGRDVTVTVNGPQAGLNSGLVLFGDGTIINRANINTQPNPDPFAGASPNFAPINTISVNRLNLAGPSTSGLNFVNEARVDDGVFGIVRGFQNSGTIGLATLQSNSVQLEVTDTDRFRFQNSGTIQRKTDMGGFVNFNGGVEIASYSRGNAPALLTSAQLENTGTIAGGISAQLRAADFSFTNTGTITPITNLMFTGSAVSLSQYGNDPLAKTTNFSFVNTGTLGSSVGVNSDAATLTFSNATTISGQTSISHNASGDDSIARERTTFINDGSITSAIYAPTVEVDTSSKLVDFTNGGTISAGSVTDLLEYRYQTTAVLVENETLVDATNNVTNRGTISNLALGGSGLIVAASAGTADTGVDPNKPTPVYAGATVNITNSGTVRANSGAVVNVFVPCCVFPPDPNSFTPVLELVSAVGGFAQGVAEPVPNSPPQGSIVTIRNETGGLIESNGALRLGNNLTYGGPINGYGIIPEAAPGLGSIAVAASGAFVELFNRGTIRGGTGGTFTEGTQIAFSGGGDQVSAIDMTALFPDRYIAGAIQTFNSTDFISNLIGGTIIGSIDVGAGDDRVQNSGTLQGNVFLRAGNDAFAQSVVNQAALQGIVDGGAGIDELQVDAYEGTGQAFNFTPFVNFEKLFVFGVFDLASNNVNISGNLAFDTIDLQEANLMVNAGQTLSTTGPVTITGSDYRDGLVNNGTITGNVMLGGGEDVVSGNGAFGGNVELGNGGSRLSLGAGGTIAGNVNFTFGNAQRPVTIREDVLENAGTINGTVSLGEGPNTVVNSGIIASALSFGEGANVLNNSGSIAGAVDMGKGPARVTNSGSILGGITFRAVGPLENYGPDLVRGGIDNGPIANDVINLAGGTIGAITFADLPYTLTNSGSITGALTLGTGTGRVENSGTISSGLSFAAGDDRLTNSGTISGPVNLGAGANSIANLTGGTIAGALTAGDGNDSLTNSGTISGNVNLGGGANTITNAAGGVVGGVLSNTSGTAVNLGVINGGVVNAAVFDNRAGGSVLGVLSNAGAATNAGTLAAVNNATAGTFINAAGGTAGALDNSGTSSNAGTLAGVNNAAGASFTNLASGTAGAVANAGTASNAGTVASLSNTGGNFSNSGTVTVGANVSGGVLNSTGTIAGGLVNSAIVNANGGAINGAIANNAGGVINVAGTVASDSIFQNTAASAALNVNSGTYTIGGLLTNAGGIVVESGATLVDRAGVVNTATGTILVKVGGTLIDALDNAGLVTNNGAYTADVNNSTASGVITNTGTGVWTGNLLSNVSGGAVTNQGRWTGTASNAASLTNSGTWSGAVTNDAGGTLTNAGTLSGAVGNAGTFNNAAGGTVSGLVTNTGGTTSNAGTLAGGAAVNGGVLASSGSIAGATSIANGGQLDNSGTLSGAVTNAGTLNQSGGTIANTLTNTGTVNASGGAINGTVANNAGGVINVNGAVTGSGSLNNSGTINFASGALALTGAATNTGVLNFTGGALGASSLTNTRSGQITGTLNFTGGADSLINEGQIAADVVLGAGDDIVTLRPGAAFGASVNGGAGNDLILLAFNGTETAPEALQLGGFAGFEILRHTSGVSTLGGSFGINAIEVNGGRLIGLAGSTITAPNITIANGATFGSAGRVVGNITNNGTLSPGASPGTMTVAGNVSLASGSTTLFELGTTVSDQLLISGTLSIASGATLNLTGSRPLTPGSTLDLIVADGGITGSFGTINKPASILGFVAQRGNRIQLLGQFATDAGFGAQTNATIGYVNNVLIAGQGSTALLNALPSLLTQAGGTSGGAFALISPEAYASATQIGQENGMAISTALRSSIRSQARTGPFVFGQAMGNWRQFRDDAALGTSRGNVSSTGFFAGLGIGGEMASFGAFAGYVDGRQRINALGAKTDADGMVFGLTGSLTSGKLEASASLVHDGSKASTRRALPGGGATSASYKLKGLTADVSIGYVLPVGGNWAAKPEVGFTHISTRRGAVSETGSAAFDLSVLKQKTNATFVDAGITLLGGQGDEAKIKPWLMAGVRHQLGGDGTSATGGFKGINATYTVAGVDRRETLLSLGAGLSAQLSEGVSFNAGYRGEFGKGNAGHNVTAGIKVGF